MLKVKPFKQKMGFCGPASLKMVLEYFGENKSETQLGKMTNCKPSTGSTAESLLNAAKKLGLKGFIKDNSTIKDLKRLVLKKKIPVIVAWFSWNERHYSVIVDVRPKNVFMQDPELGHARAVKIEEFKQLWFDFPKVKFPTSKEDFVVGRMIVIYKQNYKKSLEKKSKQHKAMP